MRLFKKKYVTVLFIFMISILVGCGNAENEGTQSKKELQDVTYDAADVNLKGIKGEIRAFAVNKEFMYISTVEFENGEKSGGIANLRVYKSDIDALDLKEIKFDKSDDMSIVSMSFANDGKIVGLLSPNNLDDCQEINTVAIFNEEGKEIKKCNVADMHIDSDTLTGRIFYGRENKILLVGKKYIYILNDELNLSNKVEIEEGWQVVDIALSRDGRIICVESDENTTELSTKAYVLNAEMGKKEEEIKINWAGYTGEDYIMNGVDADVYYKTSSGIYSYDIENEKCKELLDYEASYVTLEEGEHIQPVGNDKFYGLVHERISDNGSGLVLYSKIDASENRKKQSIIFGGFYINDEIKNQIAKFNKYNKEYRIEIKEYYQEEARLDKLNADIISGNGPDIFDLSSLPVDKYVELGLLEDLTPYLEKDDDINEEDIVKSVADAMKINGKIYYISSSFSVNTLVARTKDVGDKNGWNFQEMQEIIDKKGDGVDLLDGERNMLKGELLYSIINAGYMDFVDREKGECTFNGKDFKYILEYCNKKGLNKQKQMTDFEEEEKIRERASAIRNGKVLLYNCSGFNVSQIQVDKAIFGDDITYIGYPNAEREGTYFTFNNQIGISAKSKSKEKAWEFVRSFMLKEYQGKRLSNDSIMPTRQDCFDMLMNASMTTEEYIDEFGNDIKPLDWSWSWGGVELKYQPVTKDDLRQFLDVIQNTKKVQEVDEYIEGIIYEEAEGYFSGKNNIDKTVEIIQDRVTKYINEQK